MILFSEFALCQAKARVNTGVDPQSGHRSLPQKNQRLSTFRLVSALCRLDAVQTRWELLRSPALVRARQGAL